MDSVTHIFLGAAIAQSVAGRRIGHSRAFIVGALAATIPDFDIFLHTGNAIQDHALHRHFTHALVLVPLLAALALVPFLFHRKSRPLLKPLYLAALVACVSHTLLDALTSYGTMIFWPFSHVRYALDIIPVIDPLYTIPLILGAIFAWKRRSLRPAVAAIILSSAYMVFATLQHARAVAAQRQLLASRQVENPVNPRVLPQVGAVISYRSIYIQQNTIYADAIRVPYFAAPTYKNGGSLPLLTFDDLAYPTAADAPRAFAVFSDLADGYLARSPKDPLLIADERYTYFPEGLEPVWGMQIEQVQEPAFRITPRYGYFGKLLRDLFRPRGYTLLARLPSNPSKTAPLPSDR